VELAGRDAVPSRRVIVRSGAGVAIALGTAVLLGWLLDVAALRTLLPTQVPVAAEAAVGFVLAGVGLLAVDRPSRVPTRIAAGLLVVVTGVSAANRATADGLAGIVPGTPHGEAIPAGMSTATAVGLLLLAAALVLGPVGGRPRRVAVVFGVTCVLLGVVATLGHVYSVDELTRPLGTRVSAMGSGVALLALGGGVIAAWVDDERWRLLRGDRPAGLLLRWLLPLTLGSLVVTGYLRLLGERLGWYGAGLGTSMLVVLNGAVVVGALVATAGRVETQQRWAEDERARVERAQAELARQARELNDEVIQRLASAWLAFDLDDAARARREVERATAHAQRIARHQLSVAREAGNDAAELLTRELPAGSDDVAEVEPTG
jgi:hypothetical protein